MACADVPLKNYSLSHSLAVGLRILAGFHQRCVRWWTPRHWHWKCCGVWDSSWSSSTTMTPFVSAISSCGRLHAYPLPGTVPSRAMIWFPLLTVDFLHAGPTLRRSMSLRASWLHTVDSLSPTWARNCVGPSLVRPWLHSLTGYVCRSVAPVALTL